MNYRLSLVIFAICSYLFGSINFALIISKLKHKDIRKMGSGNPGTLNMSRNLGIGFGVLTLFLDMLKGALPTLLAFLFYKNTTFDGTSFVIADFALYLCGLCVILGHIFPIYFKFHGGKGIASTIGVVLVSAAVRGVWVLLPVLSFVLAFTFIYFTEFGGMGSFIAITPTLIFGELFLYTKYKANNEARPFLILSELFIFAFFFFTWFAHRKNIYNMLNGTEHPTSIKRMIHKKTDAKSE